MKKITILALIGITLSCSVFAFITNNNILNSKADIATYLEKQHCKKQNIGGVLSNVEPYRHNMYDDTF